jgi:hypothetical protein
MVNHPIATETATSTPARAIIRVEITMKSVQILESQRGSVEQPGVF